MRTAEREAVPGDFFRCEEASFEALVITRQAATDDCGRVDDDHRGAAGIRIHVDQVIQPDLQTSFFAGLANRSGCDFFAAIDETSRKDPLPVARLDCPTNEHKVVALVADDGSDRDLGIEIKDEAAAHADEAFRLVRAQHPAFEVAATHRAVAVGAFVMRKHTRPKSNLYNSQDVDSQSLSLIHISEPTRLL